ncbi:leucine-rich repeat domain-containing protein [Breoghania sp.]|uniref:leucine-rich repeat domain-containing protein n=1 Tax=Breoghania sp. TaxID=2065378 RepID=UPI0029CA9334|nr:leucine-rich repeat domain-containing protein [Breoghania sp.]
MGDLRLFISYCHKDRAALERLLTHLKPDLDHFRIDVWFDERLTAGTQWDDTIRREIQRADLFLLLLSPDFLASSYIMDTEWPEIERARQSRDAFVAPVLAKKCSFKRRFGALHVRPQDGNGNLKAIAAWKPQDEGHYRAAQQLSADIHQWRTKPPEGTNDPGGLRLVATPDGYDLVETPPSRHEREDPLNRTLHEELKRNAEALAKRAQRGLGNTHPRLVGVVSGLSAVIAEDLADIDVPLLWTRARALQQYAEAFAAPDQRAMTEPLEPEDQAQTAALASEAMFFAEGFAEGRRMKARVRAQEAEQDPAETLEATRDTLKGLLKTADLLTMRAEARIEALSGEAEATAPENVEAVASVAVQTEGAVGSLARTLAAAVASVGRAANNGVKAVGDYCSVAALALALSGQPTAGAIEATQRFLATYSRPVTRLARDNAILRRLSLWAADYARDELPGPAPDKGLPPGVPGRIRDDDEEIPEDVEDRVRKMILAGQAPPEAWVPYIRELDLEFNNLVDLRLLSDLTALQVLDVSRSQVMDLTPLSGMTALQSLNLSETRVADPTPLAGMTALQSLNLSDTQVIDLTPLAGMTTLQSLNLSDTQVIDLTPLAGMTTLQSLNLCGTQVIDLTPLAGMTALQSLNLSDTQVTDLTPLFGLMALQVLQFSGTQVTDLTPLFGMTALQVLQFSRTQVTDLTPLAGMTALQLLDISHTLVTDFSALAGIIALHTLDLESCVIRRLPSAMPQGLLELNLHWARWPKRQPLPDVPNQIDPDGTVHEMEPTSEVFEFWKRRIKRGSGPEDDA